MPRALITGGNGFIGRHLAATLRQGGVEVWTIGRRKTPDCTHIVLEDGSWSVDSLRSAIQAIAPSWIFHLAGAMHGTPEELQRVNLGLTQHLLKAVDQTTLHPLLVIAGSAAEYGAAIRDGEPIEETAVCAPLSAYAASKHAQTREALAYADATGNPVLVARIFNPLGCGMPAHLALGDFAHQLASIKGNRGTLYTGNIDVRRDTIDVEHIACLLYRLAENPAARGIINICSGHAPLLRDLVAMLVGNFGKEVNIEIDPRRLRPSELRTVIGSTTRLARFGGPLPVPDFPAAIARLAQAMKKTLSPAAA
jgi:GDP-4-dehydro-6-deoxy-D-mannose reductase